MLIIEKIELCSVVNEINAFSDNFFGLTRTKEAAIPGYSDQQIAL